MMCCIMMFWSCLITDNSSSCPHHNSSLFIQTIHFVNNWTQINLPPHFYFFYFGSTNISTMKFSFALFLASVTKISGNNVVSDEKYAGVKFYVDCKHSGTTNEATSDYISVNYYDANKANIDADSLYGTDTCNGSWVRCLHLPLPNLAWYVQKEKLTIPCFAVYLGRINSLSWLLW